MSGIPPLRITNTDGTFNQIPVFELEMSGGVLTKLSPTKVQLAIAGAQGPSGPAGTITIGSGISGAASAGYVLYVSGATLGQVSSGFFVDTSRTITTVYPISGGGNLGVNRVFAVDTAFLVNTGRAIQTAVGLSGGGTLSADRTLVADTALLVTTGRTISAGTGLIGGGDLSADRTISLSVPVVVTSGGTGVQTLTAFGVLYGSGASAIQALPVLGSGALIVGSMTTARPHVLPVGSHGQGLVVDTSVLGLLTWAATGGGGGSGTVNTGSSTYLAYYPGAGTTVDDTTISVSTGAGVASFNLTILTSPVVSIANGDVWFVSSNNIMYLGVRSSNVNYFVSMAS